jgi:hypothetical protein
MIANRRTFIVKPGCWDEAVALAVAETKRVSFPHPERIYTSNIGLFDRLVYEAEFENLAEYEKYWAEWFATPEADAFLKKWNDLLEAGGTNEIWTLEECS